MFAELSEVSRSQITEYSRTSGRAESFKKNYPFAYATLEEAETSSFLMEETVNPVGNIRRAERCCHTRRTITHVGVRYHVGKNIVTRKLITCFRAGRKK